MIGVTGIMLVAGVAARAAPDDASVSAGDVTRGRAVFAAQCADCHSAAPDESGGAVGPSLSGVVGRPIGAVADFRYTRAMAAKGGRWTAPALASFLADPPGFIQGTAMSVSVDAQDRRDVIAFLATTRLAPLTTGTPATSEPPGHRRPDCRRKRWSASA